VIVIPIPIPIVIAIPIPIVIVIPFVIVIVIPIVIVILIVIVIVIVIVVFKSKICNRHDDDDLHCTIKYIGQIMFCCMLNNRRQEKYRQCYLECDWFNQYCKG
jgi:hypothetical protein